MTERRDTYRHKGMRKKLAETLQSKGISDGNVLKAVENVPRHFFMDNVFLEQAYEDKAFPINKGQTISQPFTVAYQTELLQVKPGNKVLEVGTGSGYQASILVEMGAKVYSIERQKGLHERAKELLPEIGYGSIKLFFGDGYEGKPAFAPFDRIIITAAAPEIPKKLIEQLKEGGRMVVPVGDDVAQKMVLLTKDQSGEVYTKYLDRFKFVPMLPGKSY